MPTRAQQLIDAGLVTQAQLQSSYYYTGIMDWQLDGTILFEMGGEWNTRARNVIRAFFEAEAQPLVEPTIDRLPRVYINRPWGFLDYAPTEDMRRVWQYVVDWRSPDDLVPTWLSRATLIAGFRQFNQPGILSSYTYQRSQVEPDLYIEFAHEPAVALLFPPDYDLLQLQAVIPRSVNNRLRYYLEYSKRPEVSQTPRARLSQAFVGSPGINLVLRWLQLEPGVPRHTIVDLPQTIPGVPVGQVHPKALLRAWDQIVVRPEVNSEQAVRSIKQQVIASAGTPEFKRYRHEDLVKLVNWTWLSQELDIEHEMLRFREPHWYSTCGDGVRVKVRHHGKDGQHHGRMFNMDQMLTNPTIWVSLPDPQSLYANLLRLNPHPVRDMVRRHIEYHCVKHKRPRRSGKAYRAYIAYKARTSQSAEDDSLEQDSLEHDEQDSLEQQD